VPVRFEPALEERDCGAWSGMTLTEIATAYPADWHARAEDPYHHRPPRGENLVDMEQRVTGFLDALLAGAEQRVTLVTHGVMSRVILKQLLGLAPGVAVQVRHPNELFYQLDINERRCLGSAHFIAGQGPRRGLLHSDAGGTIPGVE
jgi:broad specificity phosphatase PhoE